MNRFGAHIKTSSIFSLLPSPTQPAGFFFCIFPDCLAISITKKTNMITCVG